MTPDGRWTGVMPKAFARSCYRPPFCFFTWGLLYSLLVLHSTVMLSLSRLKRMPASITKTLPFITTTTVSTSRIPTLSFSHLSRPPYSLYSPRFKSTISHGKGKNKARNHYGPSLSSSNPLSTLQLLNHARYRIAENHVLPRSFHASARRDAIPLIPVGISVVKVCCLIPFIYYVANVYVLGSLRLNRCHCLLSHCHLLPSHRYNRSLQDDPSRKMDRVRRGMSNSEPSSGRIFQNVV